MRYTPFDVDLQDINETHLADLRDVALFTKSVDRDTIESRATINEV